MEKSPARKLYHAIRSRSAYMGANARRRATIARLTDADGEPPGRSVAVPRIGKRQRIPLLLPFEQAIEFRRGTRVEDSTRGRGVDQAA